MKEFKVIIQITDTITINADSAENAWEQVKKTLDPRILGGPLTVQVIPIEESTATISTQ